MHVVLSYCVLLYMLLHERTTFSRMQESTTGPEEGKLGWSGHLTIMLKLLLYTCQ